MRLGYNTNGFAHHRLSDALEIIAELGFRSVGLTLDYLHLFPYGESIDAEVSECRAMCRALDVVPVVETGARFVLDPRRKHQPTLLSEETAERRRRLEFLERGIDIAAALGSPAVSLWSGRIDSAAAGAASAKLDERLADGLRQLCRRAASRGVVIAFEPEPGMYIEDLAGYQRIRALVDHPAFLLTLDVGHAHLTEPDGAAAAVHRVRPWIANVHLEGMKSGVHEHLPPDEGDMDLGAVVAALLDSDYDGPATLELSRHSHDAVAVARRAVEFFAPYGLP